MLTAEKNRLTTAGAAVRPHIKAHISWLEGQRDDLDRVLRERLQASPLWWEKEQLLRSVPGIGPGASLNPVIRAFYQRLIAAGKPPKVALTACVLKLLVICNALLRTNTPWDPAYAA